MEATLDSVFQGALRLKQLKNGYRFSVDSVILTHFAGPLTCEKVLDLGAGCGVVSLILAVRYPFIKVFGVEIQESLARIAAENVRENRLSGRVSIHHLDMRETTREITCGPVDLALCNPPFHPLLSGRLNPGSEKAMARHEVSITLPEIVDTASRILREGGRFAVIYPVRRLEALLSEMRERDLCPRRVRFVHPKEEGPAKLVLVEGVKGGGGGLSALTPLMLYRVSGEYTDEAAAMFLP